MEEVVKGHTYMVSQEGTMVMQRENVANMRAIPGVPADKGPISSLELGGGGQEEDKCHVCKGGGMLVSCDHCQQDAHIGEACSVAWSPEEADKSRKFLCNDCLAKASLELRGKPVTDHLRVRVKGGGAFQILEDWWKRKKKSSG